MNQLTASPDCAVSGASKTPEYRVWASMKSRCSNPKQRGYRYYAARGIKVCERWANFCNFIADMGPRPSSRHSIERIDNKGDYTPENCKWATLREQALNKSTTKVVEINGEKMSLREYTIRFGVPRSRAMQCLKLGEPLFPPPSRAIRPYRPRRQYFHPDSGKPISRERFRQLKWHAKGLCPRCPQHRPAYRGGNCKPCYVKLNDGRLPKPHRMDGGASRRVEMLKGAIGTHRKWIANYRARCAALVAKHEKWIARYKAEIAGLQSSQLIKQKVSRS